MKKICVIGSLNVDFSMAVEKFPLPGETVSGRDFTIHYGGKGANQAVAVSVLGAPVQMVGLLGDDEHGRQYQERMTSFGIVNSGVKRIGGTSTGVAVINVDHKGENTIVIVPGANGMLDCEYIKSVEEQILQSDIFMLQLEIPCTTVEYTASFLEEKGKTVILDPAPAQKLSDLFYRSVDYITPNSTEVGILTGIYPQCSADYRKAGKILLDKGVGTVIIKSGTNGAFVVSREDCVHVPAFPVDVKDTTAAGDSFNAGFAVSLAEGRNVYDSVRFANAVGALSTTGYGAQDAMPDFETVNQFIKEHNT